MSTRQLILAIAIVLAAGTGFLTFSYLSTVKSSTVAEKHQTVYVATHDIQAKATVNESMFRAEVRPLSAVDPDAITSLGSIHGEVALTSIPDGAILTRSRVGRFDQNPLPVRLRKGMRAITIPIDQVKGVAGFIQAGDHVDILAVLRSSGVGVGENVHAYTFLRNILVLAVGSALEQNNPGTQVQQPQVTAPTATLEVNPKQADILAQADTAGTLRLMLRPPNERSNAIAAEPLQFPSENRPVAFAQQAAPMQARPVFQPAMPSFFQPMRRTAPMVFEHRSRSAVSIIDGDKLMGGGF